MVFKYTLQGTNPYPTKLKRHSKIIIVIFKKCQPNFGGRKKYLRAFPRKMHIFQPLPSNGGPLSSQTSHRWSRWCRSTAASGHPGHALIQPAESAIFQPGVTKKTNLCGLPRKKNMIINKVKKNTKIVELLPIQYNNNIVFLPLLDC